MSEQQYRVVADRDKGDDPGEVERRPGDRLIYSETVGAVLEGPILVRIERPVPTREQTAVDEMGWLVFYSKVSQALIESPDVPTGMRPDLIAGEVPTIRDQVDIYDIARVVFALFQNGADRD